MDQVRKAVQQTLTVPRKSPCLGLAFKANIDDVRESPAIEITKALHAAAGGRRLNIVEPHVQTLPRGLQGLDHVALIGLEEALDRSSVVALLVDHDQFKNLDVDLNAFDVVDTRGIWTPA